MASDPMAEHLAAIKHALERGGTPALIDYINGVDSDPLRRVLYIAAQRVLTPRDFQGKNYDDLIAVCEAAIAEMLRQAEAAPDEETRGQCLHGAHIVSYNLAAELADCWPGDDAPRSKAHYQRGLKAAEDCLGWSGPAAAPGPISRDHWVKGMHQLSLGNREDAIESWTTSLQFAIKDAESIGQPTSVTAGAPFGVILSAGYLSLARWIGGQESGKAQYEEAIAAFTSQLGNAETKDQAQLGIGQLEKVKETHAGTHA